MRNGKGPERHARYILKPLVEPACDNTMVFRLFPQGRVLPDAWER